MGSGRPSDRASARGKAAVAVLCAAIAAVALALASALTGGASSGGASSASSADASSATSGDPVDSRAAPRLAEPPREAPRAAADIRRRGDRPAPEPTDRWPEPRWRDSAALGIPEGGRLARGVRFPREGRHFFTWDPVERESPNRPWRRWGTDDLVRLVLDVLAEHRRAYPRAPRLGVGDLSRPHGGDFGPQYGIVGHASHQNGLDADIYYPLESGEERAPLSVDEVALRLSQDLVDRFVAAGAEKVFVGPATGLTGPPEVVQAIPYHDNHLHVRIPDPG